MTRVDQARTGVYLYCWASILPYHSGAQRSNTGVCECVCVCLCLCVYVWYCVGVMFILKKMLVFGSPGNRITQIIVIGDETTPSLLLSSTLFL